MTTGWQYRRVLPTVLIPLIAAGCSGGAVDATGGGSESVVSVVDFGGSLPAQDLHVGSVATSSTVVAGDTGWVPVETGIPEYDELLAKYQLSPIDGYGDYSGVDRFEIDRVAQSRRLAQCAQDQGFAVVADDFGSISFTGVPAEQNELAFATLIACRVGMKVDFSEYVMTDDQLGEVYAYQLALMKCYEAEGYSLQGEVISLDAYLELGGMWQAMDIYDVPAGGTEWNRAERACPQSPVGGYGAWEPGDPVVSIP